MSVIPETGARDMSQFVRLLCGGGNNGKFRV